MNRYLLTILLSILLMAILSGCSVFGIRSGYEQLKYTVVDTIQNVEIRQYPSRIVAEVTNAKDDNDAFMTLFGYISGKNSTSEKVAMTSPVQVDKASVKIAMTAPVQTSKADGSVYFMRFFLPTSLTLESAPKPTDPRIKIISLPNEVYAAITYSGSGSVERFRKESDQLMNILSGSKWKPVSPASFLGYDPPFAIPFLRRNEAIVKVEER